MGYDPHSATHRKAFLEIDVRGEITDETADRIVAQLRASPKARTLWINIQSEGGSEPAGWRIYRAIRDHKAIKKVAVGRGQVASAAVLVFVSADIRRVLPGTQILLHGVECEPETRGRWTAEAFETTAARLRRQDEKFAAELAARCEKPLAVFMARLADETPTSLLEAQSLGLVHEVISKTDPLSRDWPAKARAALVQGDPRIYGAAGYKFSEQYLRACALS